jgi:hypothetical protein
MMASRIGAEKRIVCELLGVEGLTFIEKLLTEG